MGPNLAAAGVLITSVFQGGLVAKRLFSPVPSWNVDREKAALADSNIRRQAGQKVRFGVACVRTAESDLTRRTIGNKGGNIVVPIPFSLSSDSHHVRTSNQCNGIFRFYRSEMRNFGAVNR